jgi:small subunit ribosomal protein S8
MVVSDNIGDLLIRIKNCYMASKLKLEVWHSKENENLVDVLKEIGFVKEVKILELEGNKKKLDIILEDVYKGIKITVKRISKPGRRRYIKFKDIYSIKGGKGNILISTSKGIMTGKVAKKNKLGGELLAEIF